MAKKPKITVGNIKKFVEGNYNMLKDGIVGLPKHTKEQVVYRSIVCGQSCFIDNDKHCRNCGCSLPGKWYVKQSCNPEKFPDLLSEEGWEKYKSNLEAEVLKQIIDAGND